MCIRDRASRPPDAGHQFGHGKAEYFSALVEGAMIVVAATMIIITAVQRLFEPQPIEEVGLGLAISVAASLINAGVAFPFTRSWRNVVLGVATCREHVAAHLAGGEDRNGDTGAADSPRDRADSPQGGRRAAHPRTEAPESGTGGPAGPGG